MPLITFSNGIQCYYNYPVRVIEIALNLDSKAINTYIAGRVNGKLYDLDDLIIEDAIVEIITEENEISLEIIRYSCLYLLGYTIKEFWPNAKMAIASINDKGFYYDIDAGCNLTFKDIEKIEKRMFELTKSDYKITKKIVNWKKAYDSFKMRSEPYKMSILSEYFKENQNVNLYEFMEYIDVFRGPLVPNMRFCHNFKLQKVAGAYWKDNKNNKMLSRIYGTSWVNTKQLTTHFKNIKKLEKRDHRQINKYLNLYHMQEDAPGMVFWHNDGWIIFRELEKFLRNKLKKYEYQEIKTPFLIGRSLWERTGHWNNYKEEMFTTFSDHREYCVKPMNCPAHAQIFKYSLKSYRDLPFRVAEFGSCHRKEPSGALHGLMRVRSFTQDDAHIFCEKEQIFSEVDNCIKMLYEIYNSFGFKKISVQLSTRPEKRMGSNEIWDQAEDHLIRVLKKQNISFSIHSGEGAFYGPKIEFTLYDCLNRSWQCGTIQLDFVLPESLNIFYTGKNNKQLIPVMIHRAILGSMERFIGILIEEYAGCFPTWLSPLQVVVMNITNSQIEYVKNLTLKLQGADIRVKADLRNEKIGFKIREHALRFVPYILVCGNREVEQGNVAVRIRKNKTLKFMNVNIFIEKLKQEIFNRNFHHLED